MTPANDEDARDDETFFARWSRRKTRARAEPDATVVDAEEPVAGQSQVTEPAAPRAAGADPAQPPAHQPAEAPARGEDDFADVDFDKLDFQSDYARFLRVGVPENIRRKALAKLWASDPIFAQVDPFQDYAGDYTDAAMVPKGLLRTAYKVGRGHLNDDEAYAWERLGKGDVDPAVSALPVLKPGFRVRTATPADAQALFCVRRDAVRGPLALALGDAIAASLLHGLSAATEAEAIESGTVVEVAIDDHSGSIVAFASHRGDRVDALYTAPGRGRRGLATALLERIEARMRTDGVIHARLETTAAARRLFERQGYRVAVERRAPMNDGTELTLLDMTHWLITPADVTIAAETPDQPEVAAFFAASEAYASALYPVESNHFAPLETLLRPNVLFLVARAGDRAVGCGAIVKGDDATAELKRMWVDPSARGLKLGARLLATLESAAREDGVSVLRLETGIRNDEALGLYRRAGFLEIAAFGDYAPDPLSVFMEKALAPAPA
jgi:putative acetyltransferase